VKHVFRATKMGWDKEQEGVWFDSDTYSKEEAQAEFKPYNGTNQRGYSYTGYEYDGQKYHDYTYLGEYEDGDIPRNNDEYIDSLINKNKDWSERVVLSVKRLHNKPRRECQDDQDVGNDLIFTAGFVILVAFREIKK